MSHLPFQEWAPGTRDACWIVCARSPPLDCAGNIRSSCRPNATRGGIRRLGLVRCGTANLLTPHVNVWSPAVTAG